MKFKFYITALFLITIIIFSASKNYKKIKIIVEKGLKGAPSFDEQAKSIQDEYNSLLEAEIINNENDVNNFDDTPSKKFDFEKLLFLLAEVNRIIRLSITFDESATSEIAHLSWLQRELIQEQAKYIKYISEEGLIMLKNSKRQRAIKAHIYYRRAISSSLSTISGILSRKNHHMLKAKKSHIIYH